MFALASDRVTLGSNRWFEETGGVCRWSAGSADLLVGDFDGSVGVEDEGFVEPVDTFVMASAQDSAIALRCLLRDRRFAPAAGSLDAGRRRDEVGRASP